MCVTVTSSSRSDRNRYAFRICVVVFASICGAMSQAHLVITEHEEFRARPPAIITNRLEQRNPSEVMVDLSNDLAYKLLHLHSILNRNNFAFSPAALMCVLVAIYEGSAGRSSLELRNALLLPNNRDIVRVGYRDIHRRLRTYFFHDENPLKGLSLNKENVTITAEYETILKFYGYDLGMDMISSTATPATSSTADEATSTTAYPTTTTKEMEKTSTTEPAATMTITTTQQTTTVETTTSAPQTTTVPTTTELSTDETTTIMPTESDETVTEASPQKEKANYRRFKSSGKLISRPNLEYLPAKLTKIRQSSSRRSRRHLFGLKNIDANLFFGFLPPQPELLPVTRSQETITIEAIPPPSIELAKFPPIEDIAPVTTFGEVIPGIPINNAFQIDIEQGFIPTAKQGLNSELVDHIFHLNNQEIIHTTFKVYNSVLYYKYFEQLRMSVLELELDSTDYNLMIFLPDFEIDFLTATSSLRLGPTLRTLRKQLKPRWVQAIIPDFKLHGTMFLTNDLQNLGICDIFEPNRADFRPMTDLNGIYVKHIEQAINVNIRTRPINHLKRSYGQQARPIQVSVNHPFMFFIIDRDLDVATMTGRVLNPLNVRIQ